MGPGVARNQRPPGSFQFALSTTELDLRPPHERSPDKDTG